MSWLKRIFRRKQLYGDLSEEIRAHLDEKVEELVASGMTRKEAEHAAQREFGNVMITEENAREIWRWPRLENFLIDVRYALRVLRKSPGFTIVAILTLALGIGANTAIFTLIDGIMLRTLPVSKPAELYRLGDTHQCCNIGGVQSRWSIFSYPLYRQLREHTPEFSQMAAFAGGLDNFAVRRGGSDAPPQPLVGEFVSGDYFTMLGLRAFAGRLIDSTDDRASALPAAVISYRAWQQDFSGQPSVVGETLVVNTVPFTIAGIAPPGFYGDRMIASPPDLWLPLATEPILDGPNALLNRTDSNWLYVIGRLGRGANPAAVQSQLTVELRNWLSVQIGLGGHDRAKAEKTRIILTPAAAGIDVLQHENASGLFLLAIISAMVLLIACANVATLLLARGAARRAETAVRVALGAPRARLVRQAVTESVLLALAGGLAGLFIAFVVVRVILLLEFRGVGYVPVSAEPSVAVLGFAFLLSLVTGVVFGMAPAWIGSRSEPAEALHGAGRSASDRSSSARGLLVVLQLALSVILLVGAGLLMRSLRNLETQKFGFEPEGRLVAEVNPVTAGYKPGELYGLYQQLTQRLPRIPGVVSASLSAYGPMEDTNFEWPIHVEGREPGERIFSCFDLVSPNFFRTMGTRILLGRDITAEDTPASRPIAVVNEAFVRKYLRGKNPIGKHFGFADVKEGVNYQIVGVVENAKYYYRRDHPMFFLPLLQRVPSGMGFLEYIGDIELRVAGSPEGMEPAVRRALAATNPNLTAIKIVSLPEQIAENFNEERLISRLTGLYGVFALFLACIGLYGVTAYSVRLRTREIGIRVALGAQRGDVFRMVVGGGLKLALIGVAIGIAGALAFTRMLASLLYGLSPGDPATFLGATAVLFGVAIFACYVPARRAMRVDPVTSLRNE